jgi:hypothetical protein
MGGHSCGTPRQPVDLLPIDNRLRNTIAVTPSHGDVDVGLCVVGLVALRGGFDGGCAGVPVGGADLGFVLVGW